MISQSAYEFYFRIFNIVNYYLKEKQYIFFKE